MACQDQIACEAAVASQCPEEREEVEERAAPAAAAAGGEEKAGSTSGKQPAKEAPAGVSLARAILQLPTPARNQARSAAQGSDGARNAAEPAPKIPGLVGGSSSASAIADVSASASAGANASGPGASGQGKGAGAGAAAPARPPRGPEPWSAGAAAPGPAAKTGGYREYLQARGQQALQRSRVRGAPPAPAGCAAGVPPPPPGPPMLAFDPASACGTPTGGWSPAAAAAAAAARSPTAVAAWGIAGEMQVPAAQPWLQPNAFGMPQILPAGMRQPPQYSQVMMEAVAQQGPQICCTYPQASAPCSRASSKSCVGSPIGEDLMATFMPEAFAMDRDQLAEQLRAAASCSYDD